MQAVVLAAGMGKRLGKLTQSDTKCMIEVNGTKLIDRLLDSVISVGVSRIIIVLGYKSERVKSYLGDNWKGTSIKYVINEDFRISNNIYSLWLTKEFLIQDDTLLFESDVIFDKEIVERLTFSAYPNLAVVAPFENWMDGTVVELGPNNAIEQFVPKIDVDLERIGKYFKTVNIYKFSQKFIASTYIPFLNAYLEALGRNEYYEEVLRLISNVGKSQLNALVVKEEKWYEIDTLEDLDIASTLFSYGSQQMATYSNRHGGYWRFPKLLDFCYLVNPYFPSERLLIEMQRDFVTLITNYPSTSKIQERLIASYYGVDDRNIVIGNGASEIIANLSEHLPGKRLAYFTPMFEEYRSRFLNFEHVPIFSDLNDLQSRISIIQSNMDLFDVFILVNPDNPTGYFFKFSEVAILLELFKAHRKTIIIDESFIDFSIEGESSSLIKSSILDANENLIVIKSISKSFGVPGLRLGLLASSDKGLCESVRTQLPVWNINSFAENFLQKIGKYRKDYLVACEAFVQERGRFFLELSKIEGIKVFPSEANFFMLRIEIDQSADFVTEFMSTNNILIKDLTGKIGITGNRYLRVAIRSQKDNDLLALTLRKALSTARH